MVIGTRVRKGSASAMHRRVQSAAGDGADADAVVCDAAVGSGPGIAEST
jgi:hypothetical protein